MQGQIGRKGQSIHGMIIVNLQTKFQVIRMKELWIIAIYTQLASGHILMAVHSSTQPCFSSDFSKSLKGSTILFGTLNDDGMTHMEHTFRRFWSRQNSLNLLFRFWPFKVKGHSEVKKKYFLFVFQLLTDLGHFDFLINLLSALEPEILPFSCRDVR